MKALALAYLASTAFAAPTSDGTSPDGYGGGSGEPSSVAVQRANGVKEAFQHAWDG